MVPSVGRLTGATLAVALALGQLPTAVQAAPVAGDRSGCAPYSALDHKMVLTPAGRLTIPPLRAWQLPADPTWREDPFSDKYWVIRYQSLRYVEYLIAEWCAGGDHALLERAAFLYRDWLADNPRGAAARWAWYDHPVAWRTFVFIRAAGVMPGLDWRAPIRQHGAWLAEYGGGVGNHALNANRGLLQAGCFLRRQDWIDLAISRMEGLLKRSIDVEGVTNEQAIAYQEYNYRIYNQAREELLACGQREKEGFHRVTLMPNMLAHATLPNGEYEMLGNTFRRAALNIPGTWAEFATTKGAAGPRPPSTDAVFARGFAFIRSGWGETVPYEDEVMLTLRFGPGRAFHGHDEGGALTLYGLGSRLVMDSGKNSFQGAKPWTPYFVGRSAHNVVIVEGLKYRKSRATWLTPVLDERSAFFVTKNSGYDDVSNVRTVLFSRKGRYVIVDDRLASSTTQTYRQLWHLPEDANPAVSGNRVVTNGPKGNVQIVQLLGGSTRIVAGSKDPLQGWRTYEYQKVVAVPTVQQTVRGTSARYITLLVPFRGKVSISARLVAQYSDGYEVEVTIDGRTERVTVRGTTVQVRDVIALPPAPLSGAADGESTRPPVWVIAWASRSLVPVRLPVKL